ncbi:hypothetical protein WME99_17210 [Sorangium sp. So ce136]|uniref:hypothetical protein n=1 Tax=Sorangium sp. So ce136 TaxID=3133284 RepID=UPI003F0BD3A4
MKTWHALMALGITGAGITWFTAAPSPQPLKSSRRPAVAAAAEPAPRAPGGGARPRSAPRAAALAEPPPPPPQPREAEPERDGGDAGRVEPAVIRERLDERFARERRDPAWTVDAQRTAESRVAGAIPETSEVRSIECRASMCRIETTHQDLNQYQQFVHRAFMNPETHLWNGGFFATLLGEPADGRVTTVAYLAREGEALPSIPDAP